MPKEDRNEIIKIWKPSFQKRCLEIETLDICLSGVCSEYREKTVRTKEYARFIEKLCKARLEVGLKQIDVAKKFKWPQSYISRVESGEYRLDILEVKRFAKMYGKSVEYFVK